ncbi:nuclear transport factor 2 family protein [Hominifimenecus sp. rT4P-3]|uniref:nuclear transport factor 2 family protein n=1 Tax=Hominifimenecus sp. rT4P-3 TaxID=3242979 RepID=UPI003DA3A28B
MNKREEMIKRWFDMWLCKTDMGICDIFLDEAIYIESWGPEYHGVSKIKWWFEEWNTRGTVRLWEIKQFFHKENQTIVEWRFEDALNNGEIEAFDGMSLIQWTDDDKIRFLKEFGCNKNRYDPYKNGTTPCFKEERARWF